MLLTIIEEGAPPREVPASGPQVRIGRSRECNVFIPDQSLSRLHAEILQAGDGWQIVDRGSKNGTFVNGRRIDGPTPLVDGDRIGLGKTQILFGSTQGTVVVRTFDQPTEEKTLGTIRIQEAPETALTRILVEAARHITSHRSADEVLQSLLELALRATRAERGMIARRNDANLLVPVASCPAGASPPIISRRVLERVLEHGEALSLEDLPDDLASAGTIMGAGIRSILCAPLGVTRPFSGVLYIDSVIAKADFKPSHLEVVTIIAGMADIVLESRAAQAERERLRRMEAQLQAAAEIQSALLPASELKTPGGFTAAGYHRACLTVGGDLFDFFHLGDQLGVMLADVAGKGLGAALLMANLHARWHGVRLLGIPPEKWLDQLNDELRRALPGNRFISMAFAIADAERDELLFVSAGHNPAVLVDEAGNCELLDSTGPILGILPGQTFGSVRQAFPRGSRLIIYSDGVTDQQNARGDSFGVERLCSTIKGACSLDTPGMLNRIREHLEDFAGTAAQDDDTTITVLGRT